MFRSTRRFRAACVTCLAVAGTVPAQAEAPSGEAGVPSSPEPGQARLVHQPRRSAQANVPIVFEAEVSSAGNAFVDIWYRRKSEPAWRQPVSMGTTDGRKYVGVLPAMPPGEILYYMSISNGDLEVLASSGSDKEPHHLILTAAPMTRPETDEEAPISVAPAPSPLRWGSGATLVLAAMAAVTGSVFTARTYQAANANRGCLTVESCTAGVSKIKTQDDIMWGAWAGTGVLGATSGILYFTTRF